jgi:hypothetical protein
MHLPTATAVVQRANLYHELQVYTPPGSVNLVNPEKISRSAGKSDKSR